MEATGKFSVRCCERYYPTPDEWVVDGPDGLICGTFASEVEATAAADLWREKVGRSIVMSWTAPHDDAPDSNRGDYAIKLVGTNYAWHSSGGWHAMEQSIRVAQGIYNVVAKYGCTVVAEIVAAATTR